MNSQIYTYDLYHPFSNFGISLLNDTFEMAFTESFSESYAEYFEKIHVGTSTKSAIFIRELPVESKGIPDLVVFGWKTEDIDPAGDINDFPEQKPTVRAIEAKLSNWRKGLMQAHRYKHFADASILVVPIDKLTQPILQLDLFKQLRVGLWGYDSSRRIIRSVYTPRPKWQGMMKYKDKAINNTLSFIRSSAEGA